MIRYRIFIKDRDALIRQTRPDTTKYNPVKDANDDYTISPQEHKDCGLGTPVEFEPPITEEES